VQQEKVVKLSLKFSELILLRDEQQKSQIRSHITGSDNRSDPTCAEMIHRCLQKFET